MSNMPKYLGLAGNVTSVNNPEMWNFQSGVGSQADTKEILLSFGPSSVWDFNLKGTNRKRKDIDGDTISGRDSLVHVLQCSPSSRESSMRSSSGTVSSPYVADEECFMNLDLSLQLELDIKDALVPEAPAVTPLDNMGSKPAVNLELSLSVGPEISAITSEVGNPAQHLINQETAKVKFSELFMDDGLVSPSREHGSSANACMREVSKSAFDCIPGNIKMQNRSSRRKKYLFPEYLKGGSGAQGKTSEAGSDIDSEGRSYNWLSTGKVGICSSHSALVQDHRVHGGETMGVGGPAPQKPAAPAKTDKMKLNVVEESCLFSLSAPNQKIYPIIPAKPGTTVYVPEGRVHGGSLMALVSESQAEE